MGHIHIQDTYHQRAVLNWELKFCFDVQFMCMEKAAFVLLQRLLFKNIFY